MKLFIGTSGYSYKDWRDVFYPRKLAQKEWLKFYSQNFNSVEINATFYRGFDKKVFEKWANETGSQFKFSIKGPRIITHYKKLKNIDKELKFFLESLKGLKNKLGIVLWQFPGNFNLNKQSEEKLKIFLKNLPKTQKHVFEFRNESWFDESIYSLLNKGKAGFVINHSKSFPFQEITTGNVAYIRFHGPGSLYSSRYSSGQLSLWAKKISKYLQKTETYCYFNNDFGGYAVKNAQELKNMIFFLTKKK